MAIVNFKWQEIIELISKLSIEQLDQGWVKDVIDADFTDVGSIPSDFEELHASTNFLGLFNAIINTLRQSIDSIHLETSLPHEIRKPSFSFLSTTSISEEDEESRDMFTRFWVDLTKTLNLKALMSFLFYYIYKGHCYDASEQDRELGIHAASMYFLLLAVPGSNAFRVFHPILYIKALDILRLTTKLNVGATSPRKGSQRGSRSNRKSNDDNVGDGNEDEDSELAYLSPQEASKLIRSLNILLNDFLRLAQRFSLKHSPDSLEETINILVDVTRCEIHNSEAIFVMRHQANSVTALAYNAYVALQNICNTLHGNVQKIIIIVMRCVMFNILMISRGSSDLSVRALGVIREHSVIFVKYILIQIGKESYDGVYILIQHLCLRVPDKAEYREKTAKSVIEILKHLPVQLYTQLLKWIYRFSHNEKAGHRLFTLEVISKLLGEEERQSEGTLSTLSSLSSNVSGHSEQGENQAGEPTENPPSSFESVPTDHQLPLPVNRNILSHKFLLSIIFSRCRDSAATVRSKALALLAECTLSHNPTIVESMKQIFTKSQPVVFTTPHIPNNEINCESPQDDCTAELELPNVEMVMLMLQRRALDERVTVRKSALLVMENLMKINNEMLSTKYLKVLVDHCRDPALFIRKQMVSSITAVVEAYPNRDDVLKTWSLGVLPLILDPEIKVQEKVVEAVDQLVFRRMLPFKVSVEANSNHQENLPWKILSVITRLSLHKFFSKVLTMWCKSENARPNIVKISKTHIGREYNEQIWTLLSMISLHMSVEDPSFALDYFEDNLPSMKKVGSYTLQQVLKVLSHSIKHISAERASVLQEVLLSSISTFSVNVELISAMIDTVTLITHSMEGVEESGQKAVEVWAHPILNTCDEYLKAVLFPLHPSPLTKEQEETFYRHLYTLGEVALLCPSKLNKRIFLMMQSIILHEKNDADKGLEPRMPSTQTQSSQPPAVSFTPSRRLKALAVATLGKMCLQHEDQAKRIVPALGRMLDTTKIPGLKINILFVLSDMCVRYATLVDPLMPQVTACLRDSDVQVRRTTLTLLINLLQEDYLKLKGSFFYRILQCLCDDHEDIKSTVIFYMTERLLKRFPKIFLQHFIECIFHYNCYEEHESYNKFVQSKQEKELFSLAGSEFRDERMYLYRFMLDHMPDEQRFATTQRLCQDILGGVVDGRIKLTASSLPMLEDTLMVLSSEEIKLAWLKARPEDSDQPTDQAEQAEMAGIAIKKTIISQDDWRIVQVVKRNVIENIVPILIALKHRLAESRSPLMKQLLLYFKEIMKDYKNEVKEILAGDKQFAKEIEFDLRRFEQEQQREAEEDSADAPAAEELANIPDANVNTNLSKAKPSLGSSPKLPNVAVVQLDKNVVDIYINNATSNECDTNNGEINTEKSCSNTSETPADDNQAAESSDSVSSPLFKQRRNSSVLLRQALLNSQKVVDQRRRCRYQGSNSKNESKNESKEVDHSCQNKEITASELVLPQDNEKSTTWSDLRSDPETNSQNNKDLPVNSSNKIQETPQRQTPKQPDKEVLHNSPEAHNCRSDDLLRAISTPQPNQNVINNITFVNRTQEFSSIFVDDSLVSCAPDENNAESSPQTLLLHFRSPEAFAKDEQFNRVKRSSKRSLTKVFNEKDTKEAEAEKQMLKQTESSRESNTSVEKQATKRPSGGFLESFTERESVRDSFDNSDISCKKVARKSPRTPQRSTWLKDFENFDVKPRASAGSKSKIKNVDKESSSKRNREATSLSPVIRKSNKKSRNLSKK